ncbi:MAG: hydrogenase assembly protein HupF [Acidimicrobiia bacterium]
MGAQDPASTSISPALGAELATTALAVARQFAAGATMWCLAPRWPEHARHVAVEFVHPVVMGKRALPAVAVGGPDPVTDLRSLARADDLLVAVGDGADAVIGDALRRAPAWGLETVWIGCGPRPRRARADHLLWLDDPTGTVRFDGGLVLLYHVLWELAHVCFEHPGLLAAGQAACDDEVCITCSDEGRVAEVVSAGADERDAMVRTARGVEHIDVSLVSPVTAQDLVLVHAGAAIAMVEA